MTRGPESGDNEITEEAKRKAARTLQDVGAVLKDMLREAKKSGDRARQMKIITAQEFLGDRNRRKRRRR